MVPEISEGLILNLILVRILLFFSIQIYEDKSIVLFYHTVNLQITEPPLLLLVIGNKGERWEGSIKF